MIQTKEKSATPANHAVPIQRRIFTPHQRKILYATYSWLRYRIIDPLIYPDCSAKNGILEHYSNENPLNQYNISFGGMDDKIADNLFSFWSDWTEEEFIFLANSGTIDAKTGWMISQKGRIEYYSLGLGRSLFIPKPAIRKFFFKQIPNKKEKAIISLRDTGEGNYFHFYNDIASKIFMLKNMGVDVRQSAIIVASELYEKQYFQTYITLHPLLRQLRWKIQNKNDIPFDAAVFCKPHTHRLDLIEELISPIRQIFLRKGVGRRFFVTRSSSRNRHISNIDQIHDVCKSLDLEIIDCDSIPLPEQINWFGNASHVVAIHGAGLANLFYTNGGCSVFEIFPPEYTQYLPFHYILLSRLKNLRYQCSIGEETKDRSIRSFYVNPTLFELNLRKFLAN